MLLVPWCTRQWLGWPGASTIGRLIAGTPDKMRLVPTRLTPSRQRFKQRQGNGFCADYPRHGVARTRRHG